MLEVEVAAKVELVVPAVAEEPEDKADEVVTEVTQLTLVVQVAPLPIVIGTQL